MVSVVVPVYNVSKYLADCMRSILAQNISDMEVILIDDGSTDNSGTLCDRYAAEYSCGKVIHQENAGLSAARNTGIEAAKGDFITFVDSDDMLAPGFISTALELAEHYQADFIAFSNVRCEADAQWAEVPLPDDIAKVNVYDDPIQQMQKFLLGSEIGTTAWAKVYRRELFDDVSFTTYKVVDKASRIVATTQVGYLYRKSPNSITTSGFSEKRLDSIQGKKEQLAFVFAHYPSLQKEAETGIVYACNQCLMLMAKAGYKNKAVLDEFQQLYRNYGKSYLNAPVSKKGKALTRVAMLDVKLAYRLFGIVL